MTFAGQPLTGATIDAWEDDEGRDRWTARALMPFGQQIESGLLEGRTKDGSKVSGEVRVNRQIVGFKILNFATFDAGDAEHESIWAGPRFIVPLLGIIFLPFTTLMYVLAYIPGVGLTGWGWFWVILGVFLDMGAYGSSAAMNRRRMPGYSSIN